MSASPPDQPATPVTGAEPVVVETARPDEPPAGDGGSETRGAPAEIPCGEHPLLARIEALLVSTDRPLTETRLVDLLGLAPRRGGRGRGERDAGESGSSKSPAAQVREAIEELNGAYDDSGRAFRVERLAGGWQIMTRPELGPLLARLVRDRQQTRLSQAALETLSIIGYRQPIMRAEVEAIRGVACGEVLRGLLERRLVKIVGRAEELGRPMLYGTTREFLSVFGLSSLDDLPEIEGGGRREKPGPPIAKPPAKTQPEAEAEPDPELDPEPDPELDPEPTTPKPEEDP